VFHTHIASACSKYFIYFQMYVALKFFSYCKCFMLFDRGRAEDERIWRATRWGPVDQGAEGRQMVVLWCCDRDVLVLSYSSRLLSAVRAKREEAVRSDRWAQRRGQSVQWRGRRRTGRATPASRRARPSGCSGASYTILDLHVLL
jgi:hypothetical protein